MQNIENIIIGVKLDKVVKPFSKVPLYIILNVCFVEKKTVLPNLTLLSVYLKVVTQYYKLFYPSGETNEVVPNMLTALDRIENELARRDTKFFGGIYLFYFVLFLVLTFFSKL
jgi:hypothetical protein